MTGRDAVVTVGDSQVPEKTGIWEGSAQSWGAAWGETGEKQNGAQTEPIPVFCAPDLTPVPSGQGRTWGGEPITLAAGELMTCSDQ